MKSLQGTPLATQLGAVLSRSYSKIDRRVIYLISNEFERNTAFGPEKAYDLVECRWNDAGTCITKRSMDIANRNQWEIQAMGLYVVGKINPEYVSVVLSGKTVKETDLRYEDSYVLSPSTCREMSLIQTQSATANRIVKALTEDNASEEELRARLKREVTKALADVPGITNENCDTISFEQALDLCYEQFQRAVDFYNDLKERPEVLEHQTQ